MLGRYVHAPDLTEVGGFYGIKDDIAGGIRKCEANLETQFAFCTTVRGQEDAEQVLRAADWRDLGHRYNQFHGPNFITLWFKEFPKNTKPAEPAAYSQGWMKKGYVPPKGAYSCGIWVESKPFGFSPEYLKTKYLAVWRQPEKCLPDHADALRANGWHFAGLSAVGGSIWHTAEPHDVRDYHGADYKSAFTAILERR